MNSVPEEFAMEAGTSVLLDSCQERSILMETVKNIVGANGHNEEEEEDVEEDEEQEDEEEEDEYFAVEEIPNERAHRMDISTGDALDTANRAQQRTWLERCRVCATSNDHLIPIFEGEGLEHDLCSKIHKYLPIQVSEGDSLPLQLCYHCAATLLAWHELAEGCLDAERHLLQMQCEFQQKQQLFQSAALNSPLDGSSAVATDEGVPVIDRREPLPQQSQQFESKGENNEESTTCDSERFTNHDQSSRISSFTVFQKACRALRRSYQSQVRYSASRSLQRKAMAYRQLDTVSLESGDDHNNAVETNGSCLSSMKSHEVSLPQEKLVPSNSSTNSVRSTRNVSEEKNCKMGRFSCSVCGKSFSRQTVLDKHTAAAHLITSCTTLKNDGSFADESESTESEFPPVLTANPYDCKLCGKIFRLQESFRTHMRIHTGEKPFTCHICGKQFGQTGSLYYHLKHVHGGVKNHSCDICGRSFAMKAAMEDHRRIHTGERPYICASCGKTFKTKASLYIHSKTHTDEFPYKCTYCTKAFRWRQQMLGHLTIHTGEKNHMCDICGKGFGVKNDLTRHKRIHSGEKPYVCQQCGISFGQKRYLKSHERARHR